MSRSKKPLIISFLRRFISSQKRYLGQRPHSSCWRSETFFNKMDSYFHSPPPPPACLSLLQKSFWPDFDPKFEPGNKVTWLIVPSDSPLSADNIRHFIRFWSDWPKRINGTSYVQQLILYLLNIIYSDMLWKL